MLLDDGKELLVEEVVEEAVGPEHQEVTHLHRNALRDRVPARKPHTVRRQPARPALRSTAMVAHSGMSLEPPPSWKGKLNACCCSTER